MYLLREDSRGQDKNNRTKLLNKLQQNYVKLNKITSHLIITTQLETKQIELHT